MQVALHRLFVTRAGAAEHCAEQVALPLADSPLEQSVAEKVEAHLVGGAVGDVAGILSCSIGLRHLALDAADLHAERFVEWSHPVGIALGQVVVDGGQMGALAFERGEIQAAVWR